MCNKDFALNAEQELRILYIFEQLSKGSIVSKAKMADFFNIDEKTVRRDIDKVRRYYEFYYGLNKAISYSRAKGGYIAKKCLRLSNSEIYALIKMLLENRTFDKAETRSLCEHLMRMGADEEQTLMKKLIADERLQYEGYAQIHNRLPLLDYLWELANSINSRDELEIKNQRQDGKVKVHIVFPVSLTFSEYYFYLIVYYKGETEKGPRIFRVDRIIKAKPTGNQYDSKIKEDYKNKHFEEKLQFMYAGEKVHLQFKFWGDSLGAVLDRLPNAEVIGYDGKKAIIKTDAYSKGIKMWLLSQMEYVEVIEPQSFREEMQETISNMARLYSKKQ